MEAFSWYVDSVTCETHFVSTAFGGTPPYSYYWAFGDGNTSTDANPVHQYPNNTSWTPCLTITDANGCDTTICDVVYTACTPTSCDAMFTYTFTGCNSIYFFPASTGPQYSYFWDFGDGNTSTSADPTHTYAADGVYIVVLTVTDSVAGCSDAFTLTLTINCGINCTVNGAMSWAVDSTDCSVQFVSTAFGGTPPYSYYWAFGDGNVSTLPNPNHTYPNNSTWTPCLTITDSQGCDTTICDVVFVSCNQSPCDASFQFTFTSCNEVIFVPNSAGGPNFYMWDFGDGNTSFDEMPTHTYTADGTYTVVLTMTDSLTQCTHAFTAIVTINCGTGCTINAVTTYANDSLDCHVQFVSSVFGGTAPYTYYWAFRRWRI